MNKFYAGLTIFNFLGAVVCVIAGDYVAALVCGFNAILVFP